eukprot:TRINITY_DN32502_c0_g1_i1.p1 TRINITY_DN32502_c0_g1~~TRINITY_DN32502_c0_g1_i1.p1  ORF type:complete len:108 (-),score=7.23 TRINITY_DN32502_c0_g1_i1:4-327(-)
MSKAGICRSFDDVKGFWFIRQTHGADLFVHKCQLADRRILMDGDKVRYDESWDERNGKPMASNVTGGSGGGRMRATVDATAADDAGFGVSIRSKAEFKKLSRIGTSR